MSYFHQLDKLHKSFEVIPAENIGKDAFLAEADVWH